MGAVGVDSAGKLVGRIRDRVVLVGERPLEPIDVASLDEVLFMIPRRLFQRERLSEIPELAWHAYAVEYGLRARALGLRVCAVDIPLTHNSLTLNIDRARRRPRCTCDQVPRRIAATHYMRHCHRPSAAPRTGIRGSHGWRYRWLRESFAAHAARRAVGGGSCVLSDIRFDIDEVIAGEQDSSLLVVNLDRGGDFTDGGCGPLDLLMRVPPDLADLGRMPEVVETIAECPPGERPYLLPTSGLRTSLLLARQLPPGPRLLGFGSEVGYGCSSDRRRQHRRSDGDFRSSTPFAMPALAR